MAPHIQPRQMIAPTFTSWSASRAGIGRPATTQAQVCTRTVFEDISEYRHGQDSRLSRAGAASPAGSPPKYEVLGYYRASARSQRTCAGQGTLGLAIILPDEGAYERTRLLSAAIRRYDGHESHSGSGSDDSSSESDSDSSLDSSLSSDSDHSLPSYGEARRDMPPAFDNVEYPSPRGGLRIWVSNALNHEWLAGPQHRIVYERLPDVEAQMPHRFAEGLDLHWTQQMHQFRQVSRYRPAETAAGEMDEAQCFPSIFRTILLSLLAMIALVLLFGAVRTSL